MNKLNVLRCGDQNFWAYYWIAQEHSRYSQHNVEYAKFDEINLNGRDLIYIHSPDITNYHADRLPKNAKEKNISVIGGYAGNPEYWSLAEKRTYSIADLIVTISPQTYAFAKFHYINIQVIFLPESIDTYFFRQKKFNRNSFIIGWAGGVHKPIKRAYLLDKLNFNILKKDSWSYQRFIGDNTIISHEGMREFYHSIDVLILTSKSECMPRVVLEALSCGLPVISTDVGSIKMLLDKEWIVPNNSDEEIIEKINEKLTLLKKYPSLRYEVGKRNFLHVNKYFSWEQNTKLWDRTFELTKEKKYNEINKLSQQFLLPFETDFNLDVIKERNLRKFKTIEKPQTPEQMLKSFIEVLIYEDLDYCILKQTCAEIIQDNKINTTSLEMWISTITDSFINNLKEKEFNYCNNQVSKNGTIINLTTQKEFENIKTYGCNGFNYKVPVPVISYLKHLNLWEKK